ncbi:hypothetical protein LOOC260_111120 [Paucilactobacillus hokkaidonensis JCM 18461]|uniref:Core domain-containing protein n=2 Tax=Paucilactobacillus hokkaidonensis TaxID=1193095 RepID=A0A0A1GYW1_9LACO|nr:iron-sulfur cluster biosynthesis family protein [Paucilactobacillus hokkaidonensis]BAP85651.1 hypothetical protein LOOC260_111120 [Paucilactobacillus hokkaidonensis JCM 18461]
MKLMITEAAKDKLANYLGPDKKMLLSLDDGVGPFSGVGVCSLDTAFQLILVDKKLPIPDYNESFETEIGALYYKGYSKEYMNEDMKLDFKSNFQTMPLSGDGEMIDSNVVILDLSKQQID